MTDPVVRFVTGLAQSLMAMFIRRRLGTLYTEAGLKKYVILKMIYLRELQLGLSRLS